ncbi:MAG: hypothetical protein LUQ22_06710 [Methanotrichaceae archaeon]|nr:hypothetical protein [Methanotrichaceae archaeon]
MWFLLWLAVGMIVFLNAVANRGYSSKVSFICAVLTVVLGMFTLVGGLLWLLVYASMMPKWLEEQK